ncbi:hypothetical protein OA067_00910 [Gammaproteobacteria bacterium]|nr:hypothetical protein [Gammaproteobacteria bacterium]
MKIEYKAYELLEKLLNRDSWSEDEACWFFLGFAENKDGLHELISGKRLLERDAKKAWDDFSDLKRRWNATRFDSRFAHSLDQHDKYFCVAWAQAHGMEGQLSPLLAWGGNNNLVEQEKLDRTRAEIDSSSNSPIQVEASKKRLNNRLRLIGVLVDILTDDEKKQRFASEEELKGYIETNYAGQGLSRRNLDSIFPEVKALVERK